ncbi:Long-chain-fatty-acid--CoA ligase [compost metagenome]
MLARIDDLINVSGLKVNPYEVESVILQHPEVQEVVIYRTKHSVWGEAVKALIVSSTTMETSTIRRWCKQYLPGHKIPGVIQFVNEIPKLSNGKVSRKLLESKE